jgi:hypothetical protein
MDRLPVPTLRKAGALIKTVLSLISNIIGIAPGFAIILTRAGVFIIMTMALKNMGTECPQQIRSLISRV